MKYFLLVFATMLTSIHTHAQKGPKNEIGIGIGSIAYIYLHGEKYIYKNTILFRKEERYETQCYSLPSLHYKRKLSGHLAFMLTYQFNSIKYDKTQYSDNFAHPFVYKSSELKNHQIQFGYHYSVFKNKRIIPYISVGFDLDIYKYKARYYGSMFLPRDEEDIDATFAPYGSVGLSVKIYKQFSLKYDAALTADNFEYPVFKPINRLSFNYEF